MFTRLSFPPLTPRPDHNLTCSVGGCPRRAALFAYGVDADPPHRAKDACAPTFCAAHAAENERRSVGLPQPRGEARYPFSCPRGGWTAYVDIASGRWLDDGGDPFSILDQLEALSEREQMSTS